MEMDGNGCQDVSYYVKSFRFGNVFSCYLVLSVTLPEVMSVFRAAVTSSKSRPRHLRICKPMAGGVPVSECAALHVFHLQALKPGRSVDHI